MCLSNPPLVVLPWILKKIRADQATCLLLAPNWASQAGFMVLLQMLVDTPLLLPQHLSLLFLAFRLAALSVATTSPWPQSGIITKQQSFQKKLLTSYWHLGEHRPRSCMQVPRRHGFAGVLRVVSVPFQLLQLMPSKFLHLLWHKRTLSTELLPFTCPLSLRLTTLLALCS